MWINYPQLIEESTQELRELEKQHRGTRLEARVKMVRLLKEGTYRSQKQLAPVLGYSRRQVQRWWKHYRAEGLANLLVYQAPTGQGERITDEALAALDEAMKAGQIARLEEARLFLEHRFAIRYTGVTGLSRLFKRHQIKLKTGRRRNKQASAEEQAAFKKGVRHHGQDVLARLRG